MLTDELLKAAEIMEPSLGVYDKTVLRNRLWIQLGLIISYWMTFTLNTVTFKIVGYCATCSLLLG